MKFKLPLLQEEFDIETKEVKSERSFLNCDFDFTIDAQKRWEDNFPEQSKKLNIFDYVASVKDVKIQDTSTFLIALKVIYCFLVFDRHLTFREFSRLFNLANQEYFEELTDVISSVIKFINDRYDSKKKS